MPKHQVYTREVLAEAVAASVSVREVLSRLGRPLAGGTHGHISRKIKEYGIDTSHFLGKGANKGKPSPARKTPEQRLVVYPTGHYRIQRKRLHKAMQELGVPYECTACGQGPEWNGAELVIEIDHISGDWLDCRIENLRYLCPNCHSQQRSTNRPMKNRN